MTRYATGRPRKARSFDIDEDTPFLPSLTVDDHEAVDTGLITPTGEPIMRLPNQMGFHSPDGGSAF